MGPNFVATTVYIDHSFQYPLRIVVGWDLVEMTWDVVEEDTFSIPCGSWWGGTSLSTAVFSASLTAFQYPLRIVVGWDDGSDGHTKGRGQPFSIPCGSWWGGTGAGDAREH